MSLAAGIGSDFLGKALALSIALELASVREMRPLWIEAVLAVFVAEFISYWYHRHSHAPGWLWDVHGIHHTPPKVSDGRLPGTIKGLMMYPLLGAVRRIQALAHRG